MNNNEIETAIANAIIVIDKIKSHKKYNKKYSGTFPSLETLKTKPHANFPIIVEQLQLMVNLLQGHSPKPHVLGVWVEEDDLVNLLNKIIDEVSELQGELGETIATSRWSFGQTIIPGHTLLTLARSVPLSATYRHIDLLGQKGIVESFSVSFLLRLSIESKLSTMMGFKSVTSINSNGSKFVSDHFPVGAAFRFLKAHGDSYFSLPIPISELKKVYDWSCRFVHTGRKEYIWMTLKAIDCIEKLFEGHSGTGFSGSKISNFREGKTIEDLRINLNTYFYNYNSSHIATLIWDLSEDVYDETHSFWDARST
ncbi:hypothetical protein LGN09_22615 [Burkholderia cenocepacia]|uniref:hypothetical protein n=1 Tax=Burkholderia cenocepacia TaxID=95486 RepID=UPI001CF41957|nr:hypothetical protein [Burkholderia cenocepacia]MCA8407701.1 hypothetical protein [Burkholderia cenocepacia]